VKPEFEKVDNVAQVKILGGTERQIQVNLDRDRLKNRELAVSTIAQRISASSQNVPVGKISRDSSEMLFRTLGEYRSLDKIRQTVVNFFGSDNPVNVADLGEVVDTTEDVTTYAYVDGVPGIYLDVYRQSGANTVAVVDALFARMKKINQTIKSQLGEPRIVLIRDLARPIRWNVEDVREAILLGIVLTFVVVYFFLGSFRSTFITSVALPNSMIGAFILMYVMGFTINVITLLALSLAVGLLIDDAIVVRENIWRHMELGKSPREAAIVGTNEVTLAVIATTATVISVFLPVGFLQGTVGQFFKQLGLTVVFAMTVSFFDSMTIAPLLSAYLVKHKQAATKGVAGLFENCCSPLHWAVKGFERLQNNLVTGYEKVIRFCLRHRMLILGLSLLFFVSSLALLPRIKKTFMPTQDIGFMQVTLAGAPGTSLEKMRSVSLEVQELIRKHPEVAKTALLVGNDQGEANVASFYVELVNYHQRNVNTSQMKDILRQELKAFAAFEPRVGDVAMFGNFSPFTMFLVGDDLDKMAEASLKIKTAFSKIPGLADVDTNYRPGKPEYQILLDPVRMEELGVSAVTAGSELRAMVDGVKAAKFREADHEYDILVRLKPEQRDLRQGFDKFFVPNLNFNLVRLSDVAAPRPTTGPLKINRRDRQRYIMISGELGTGGALGDIQEKAKAIMKTMELPAGVSYQFVGQAEDMRDLFVNMVTAMGLAVICIYLVLASLYESLLMPLLIMLALPLAIVGALASLFIFNQSLNMFSMIALIMLLGLVVKNSILLVDYALQLMRKGVPRREAIVAAGKIRLRPILMTTIALIAGMLPLALALSEVGRFRQSMGISIIGGLISSTLLTLLVIPSGFEWADDLRLRLRKLFGRPAEREIDHDPSALAEAPAVPAAEPVAEPAAECAAPAKLFKKRGRPSAGLKKNQS
jgi:HAE1 family hydrophobic/amphiphilic exporter-1